MRTTQAVAAALFSLALPLSLATPAQAAAPPFGAPQPSCAQKVSAVASGTVYGAGYCGGGVTILSRVPGGAWRSAGVAWPNKSPEAVADDGTTTFVVMSCSNFAQGCTTGDPLGKGFFIGKVAHGGRPSALTTLGSTSSSGDAATVAARSGTWWAAWSATDPDRDQAGTGSGVINYRKTFGGAGSGQLTAPADPGGARTFAREPSLVLTDSGAQMVFISQTNSSGATPALQLATAGADGKFTTSAYEPAAGASAESPDIAYSGGRTFIGWSRNGHPALAFAQNGTMRRNDLPYRGTITYAGLSVAASGGLVTVTTTEMFAYQNGTTSRVYARAIDTTGTVQATTELSAAAGRQDPYVRAGVTDSTAARGRATVAFWDGTRQATASQ